jgi:hypothetical protein
MPRVLFAPHKIQVLRYACYALWLLLGFYTASLFFPIESLQVDAAGKTYIHWHQGARFLFVGFGFLLLQIIFLVKTEVAKIFVLVIEMFITGNIIAQLLLRTVGYFYKDDVFPPPAKQLIYTLNLSIDLVFSVLLIIIALVMKKVYTQYKVVSAVSIGMLVVGVIAATVYTYTLYTYLVFPSK